MNKKELANPNCSRLGCRLGGKRRENLSLDQAKAAVGAETPSR